MTLFDRAANQPPTSRPIAQDVELDRVATKTEAAIIAFCTPGREFRAEELRQHVAAECQVAPGSADRILRLLKQRGVITYEVLNRRQSLYRITEEG